MSRMGESAWLLGSQVATDQNIEWVGVLLRTNGSVVHLSPACFDWNAIGEALIRSDRLLVVGGTALGPAIAARFPRHLASVFDLELATRVGRYARPSAAQRGRRHTSLSVLARFLASSSEGALDTTSARSILTGEAFWGGAGGTPTSEDMPRLHQFLARFIYRFARAISKTGELRRFVRIEMPVRRTLWIQENRPVLVDRHALEALDSVFARSRAAIAAQSIRELGFNVLDLFSSSHTRKGFFGSLLGEGRAASLSPTAVLELLQATSPTQERSRIALDLLTHLFSGDCLRQLSTELQHSPYPIYDTLGTVTGRVTMRYPGLQWLQRDLRSVVSVERGKVLKYFDYRAFEPTILAAASNDATLLRACEHDLYSFVAENLGCVGAGSRDFAKVYFLAFLYGRRRERAVGELAAFLDIPDVEANSRLRHLEGALGRAIKFKRRLERKVKRTGFARTAEGNRRLVPRTKAYLALNHYLQGTGASIFKRALVGVLGLDDRIDLVAPMHDGLVLALPDDCSANLEPQIVGRMQSAFSAVFEGCTISVSIKPTF
jgi:hypothetical protein